MTHKKHDDDGSVDFEQYMEARTAFKQGHIGMEEFRREAIDAGLGWHFCDACGWDGAFAPLDSEAYEIVCPECREAL